MRTTLLCTLTAACLLLALPGATAADDAWGAVTNTYGEVMRVYEKVGGVYDGARDTELAAFQQASGTVNTTFEEAKTKGSAAFDDGYARVGTALDDGQDGANAALDEAYGIAWENYGQASGDVTWAWGIAATAAVGLVNQATGDVVWAEETAREAQPCGNVPPLYLPDACVEFLLP